MRIAFTSHRPWRTQFARGAERAGLTVVDGPKCDLLVTWNWNNASRGQIEAATAKGARLVVVENGYIGADGERLFAMALDAHNGCGRWFIGDDDRWKRQGIRVQPWREGGTHVLVLPQRGIGAPGVAMPAEWERRTLARLKGMTQRPIRVRRHPGRGDARPLEDDLRGAWCAVTWGSGAALKAICAGVPVFHDLPRWIGRDAALRLGGDIERPWRGDREPMLRGVSWAQWSLAEIESGEPWQRLQSLLR